MARNFAYDVNAAWDDPFETRDERRDESRANCQFEVSMSVPVEVGRGRFVGPGLARDISVDGLKVLTKHQLRRGQRIAITIKTDFCPDSLGLPAAFTGHAEVEWLRALEGRSVEAGIRFGDSFAGNMDFAVFVEFVQSVSRVMTS